MTILPNKINMSAFLIGVISQSACYTTDELSIRAPEENSILLDYFLALTGVGKITKPKSSVLKWALNRDEGEDFFEFLKENMPACEGRNKFIRWLKGQEVE
mgnify:CR=1 FL=1